MSRVLIGAENGLATCQLIHGPGLLGTSRVILGADKDSGTVGVGNKQYHVWLMVDREAEVIIDQKGTTRFSASVDSEGTALTIADKLGNIRAIVYEAGDQTALQLHDSHDKLRAALGAAPCGDKKTGLTIKRPNHSLILLDKKGKIIHQVPR